MARYGRFVKLAPRAPESGSRRRSGFANHLTLMPMREPAVRPAVCAGVRQPEKHSGFSGNLTYDPGIFLYRSNIATVNSPLAGQWPRLCPARVCYSCDRSGSGCTAFPSSETAVFALGRLTNWPSCLGPFPEWRRCDRSDESHYLPGEATDRLRQVRPPKSTRT